MPKTLVDVFREEFINLPRRSVAQILAQESPILQRAPLISINGDTYTYAEKVEEAGVGFRPVNGAYPAQKSAVTNFNRESVRLLGGEESVDTYILETQPEFTAEEHLARRLEQKVISMAKLTTKKFFKGDASANNLEFDGLQVRTSERKIAQGNTAGGDALTLDKFEELGDSIEGGPDLYFMNKAMKRKITKLARAEGRSVEPISKDAFGLQLDGYNGVPLVTIEKDELGAEILGFNEAAPGGGDSLCTSIYAVRFNTNDGLAIIQTRSGLMVTVNPGQTAVGSVPARFGRVEWFGSFVLHKGASANRLHGIKNA